MSSWDKIECEFCGMLYGDLKTGLTYKEVRNMLWVNSDDYKDWKYKRRNTVLGLWHSIKIELWREHVDGCSVAAGNESFLYDAEEDTPECAEEDDEVPF